MTMPAPSMMAISATLKIPVRSGANPHVHEIDDHSVNDPIQEIGNATGYEQSHTEESPPGPAPPHGDGKATKSAVPNAEDRCSDRTWPVCTEAQETAGILHVLETKRVGEE